MSENITTNIPSKVIKAASNAASKDADQHRLAGGALGLPEVIFTSIASMAPGGAIALSIGLGAAYTGGALPLAVVLAVAACLLTAISIAQLSKHLPSAGSFSTFIASALHPYIGFLACWIYAFAVSTFYPLLLIILGYAGSTMLTQEFGVPATLWWPWTIAGAVFVYVLNLFDIKIAGRASIILAAFEILTFTALGITLIVDAGDRNTLQVFTFHYATISGFSGYSGIFAGLIFTVMAFVGFESSVPLAEEAHQPKKNIGKAVIGSVLIVGALYSFITYAGTVYFGPDNMVNFQNYGNGNPYQQFSHTVWGFGWVLVFGAILNSSLACASAGMQAASRTWYSMGRISLLPRKLGTVDAKRKVPVAAVTMQFIVGVAIALWLGFEYTPIVAYAVIGTFLTVIAVMIYIMIHVSAFAYYIRFRRSELSVAIHVVVPLVGVLLFVPTLFAAAGIQVAAFISPLPAPISYGVLAVIPVFITGFGYLVILHRFHPERIAAIGHIFANEDDQT